MGAARERDLEDSDSLLGAKVGKIGSEGVKIKFEARQKKLEFR